MRIAPKLGIDQTTQYSYLKMIKTFGVFDMYEFQMLNNKMYLTNKKSYLDDIFEFMEKFLNNKGEISEITLHLPTSEVNVEDIYLIDKDSLIYYLEKCLALSQKYDIKVNALFHTAISKRVFTNGLLDEFFEKMLNLVEGTKVNILIENVTLEQGKKYSLCHQLEIVKFYQEERKHHNIFMCLDICHAACKSNVFRTERKEYYDMYLNGVKPENVYQIHYAEALGGDGYIDTKKTHGRMHESYETCKADYDILKKYGLENSILVTEITESDYYNRPDQIQEIQYLKEIEKQIK